MRRSALFVCALALSCGLVGDAAFNQVGPPRPCIVSITLFRCDPKAPSGYGIAIWFSSEDVVAVSGVAACDATVPKVLQEHAVLEPDEVVGLTVCTADCSAVPGATGLLASHQVGSENLPSGVCDPGAGLTGVGGSSSTGLGGSFGVGVGASSDVGGVAAVGAGAGPGSTDSAVASSVDVGAAVGAGAGSSLLPRPRGAGGAW